MLNINKLLFENIGFILMVIYKFVIICYLCLMNSGFPLHLNVTDFPSGMSASLTSILAKAKTSAEAAMDLIKT